MQAGELRALLAHAPHELGLLRLGGFRRLGRRFPHGRACVLRQLVIVPHVEPGLHLARVARETDCVDAFFVGEVVCLNLLLESPPRPTTELRDRAPPRPPSPLPRPALGVGAFSAGDSASSFVAGAGDAAGGVADPPPSLSAAAGAGAAETASPPSLSAIRQMLSSLLQG